MNTSQPDISIVVPMKNESENVGRLVQDIETACAAFAFEIVLIDDGSTDDTADVIRGLQETRPHLRLIQHPTSGGQSSAVHSGVQVASAPIICTMDGDGQNPPSNVPNLVAPLLKDDPELGLVAGQRVGRQDTLSKKWASKFANGLRSAILKDDTRDTGCGLKAFRRDAFLEIPYFNNMHRYLPAMFKAYGWKVAHEDVTHAARMAGRSNYSNLQRAWAGIHDLIGVSWLIKRAKRARPMPERRPDATGQE
ncbi:glycosyltransferase family 2 protein [Shimia ponticola]|uniref:glycosyltransferase family 2 protein n=1 Tax=Shimia ponticola TaxID=2582893 RepID=UPI0011BD5618|nr:glycosyltransferase family 2 protein [Shimia ponticola]